MQMISLVLSRKFPTDCEKVTFLGQDEIVIKSPKKKAFMGWGWGNDSIWGFFFFFLNQKQDGSETLSKVFFITN